MRILVCGSRDWGDPFAIEDALAKHVAADTTILHGAARGADLMAAAIADQFGLETQPFPADWEKHGKAAGVIRNLAMLDAAPDLVIAFQRNGSRGTQGTIDEARRRGIPVEVHAA